MAAKRKAARSSKELAWHVANTQLEPHVVRIFTPDGSGTGWLVSRSRSTQLCAIATASHVVSHAHYWDEPIRIRHYSSGKTILLRPADRALDIDESKDTAAILFNASELELPSTPLPLMKRDHHLKPGVDIGWLGFPAIQASSLCFFSGHISTYLEDDSAYLVDGVAINGVSGGPAFSRRGSSAQLVGVVSAYIPNRATGEVLPGLAIVRDVNRFHEIADRLGSLDEAQAKQTPPQDPPPASSPDSGSESGKSETMVGGRKANR